MDLSGLFAILKFDFIWITHVSYLLPKFYENHAKIKK